MNVLISISYNGSKFCGYQLQPGKRTIQGELEASLKQIFSDDIKTYASGRTDAGVHALNQYVNFFISDGYDLSLLKYKLNKLLPFDIRINSIRKVNENFNSRYSSIEKTYRYCIELNNQNPFKEGLIYNCYDKLNMKKLFRTAEIFKGMHNFKNFTSKKEDKMNFIRTISKIDFSIYENIIEITFVGSGFMKYEVRMIVGNMLAYASGKITKKEIETKLNSKKRDITNYCSPAEGLYLVDVKYNLDKGVTYCYHAHTYRCGHASGLDEEYVQHAITAGIKKLGFSDHVFLKGITHHGMRGAYSQLEDYVSSIRSLANKYNDQIQIKVGFEAEYQEKFLAEYQELLKSKTIDYLILGQHCTYNNDGLPEFYTKNSNDISKRWLYAHDVIEGMKSGLFTYVCHPDLFFQGLTEDNPEIDEICRLICEASLKYDVPLELNLGGFKFYGRDTSNFDNGLSKIPYPNERFWKWAGSYQCKVVIGVDAHSPFDFEKASYDLAFNIIDKYALNYIDKFKINK